MECPNYKNDHNADKQIACTRQIWQPRFGRDLTDGDAREILRNVTGFFGLLAEWARAEENGGCRQALGKVAGTRP
jgi:hypothetical protein